MSTSPPLGFGAAPYGSSLWGLGVPALTTTTFPRVLVKRDGTQGNAPLIDPATGDQVVDARGNRVGDDSLPHRVLLALRTAFNSSSVAGLGIDPMPALITDDLPARNRAIVQKALQSMISGNLIVLVDVVTTRTGPQRVQREVKWHPVGSAQVQSTFV